MSTMRVLGTTVALTVALVLQVSRVPALRLARCRAQPVLLVVVGAGLVRGAAVRVVLGFVAGVLLDLAPPADHVAGRWALALLVVGYVAGRVPRTAGPRLRRCVATVAACSFLGTSVFALSGLVLRDPAVGIPDVLRGDRRRRGLGRPADAVRAAAGHGAVPAAEVERAVAR